MGYNEKPVLTESFVSTNDLRTKQFYGVKLSADRTVILPTANTDKCIGILQNKPNAGEVALVMVIGRTPIVGGAAVAYGASLYIDNGGKAITLTHGTDTTKYNCGQCVEHSSGDAEILAADVNFASQSRGA